MPAPADPPEPLTYEQAVAALPDGDDIHVVLNGTPGILIGADWRRDQVLALLRENRPERSGPLASASGHGIAVMRNGDRYFVQTRTGAFGIDR